MMMMTKAFSTFKDERKTKDDKTSMLERLALSTSQEEFEKALIKGSDLQRFFSLLQAINKATPEDFTKEWPEVREFCKDIENTGQGKVLRYEVLFKYLLHRIPAAVDVEERKKLMMELNTNFMHETFQTLDIKASLKKGQLDEDQKPPEIGDLESIKRFLKEDIYTGDKEQQRSLGYQSFSPSVYTQIDFVKMLKVNQDLFEAAMRSLSSFGESSNFVEGFNSYIQIMKKTKTDKYQPDLGVLKKLTLQQLLRVQGVSSNDYYKQLIVKNLGGEERVASQRPSYERAEAYRESVEFLEKSVTQTEQRNAFESYLKLLRLVDLAKIEKIDLALLDSYLNNRPLISCSLIEPKKIKESKISLSNFKVFDCVAASTPADLDEMFKVYIRKAISDKEVASFLEKFLRREELEKQLMIETLLSGQKVPVIKFLSEIELNHIRDRCEISIKEVMKDGTITVSLKNIPNLILTVYEINTVNYFKTRSTAFDSQLDIAGIIPTEVFKFAYPQPPMEAHRETFEIERIKIASRGLYIVELTGQGLSSRAVVKRGGLNLIQTTCQHAYRYCILDENKQVCCGASAKIWMADKEYLADEKGWIEIPFQTSAVNQFAIIQVNDFAEPYRIELPAIQLKLLTSVVYNEESLVGGTNCDFVINPKIMAQHGQVDKKEAADYSVTILSVNSDGVKSAKVYEDCTLNDSDSLAINYHVPKKTTSLIVTTSCKVNDQSLSSVHRLTINEVGFRKKTFDITLHKDSDKYLVRLAGLNGEPIKNNEVRVSASFAHNGKPQVVTFKTDEQGQAIIGSLLCVKSISVQSTYRGVQADRTFEFSNAMTSQFLSIPDKLDAVEGEDVMLPALKKDQDPSVFSITDNPYSFVKVTAGFDSVLEDYRSHIEEQGGVVYLSKLAEGHYMFVYHLATCQKTIQIKVSKGERWERSNEYIISKDKIRRLQNQTNYLTFDELKADEKEVNLKVYSNLPDSAKVTLLAYYSLPSNFTFMRQAAENLRFTEGISEFPISGDSQMHMSNKEISDEQKYIIYRNQLTEDQYGSTLKRPTGLLFQQFNRTTKADGLKQSQVKHYTSIVGNVGMLRSVERPTSSTSTVNPTNQLDLGIASIKEKGRLIGVKSVDADSKVSFDLSSLPSHLNLLVALVEDENNFTYKIFERQKTVNLNCEKNDIRLATSMEAGKVHYYKREVKVIRDDKVVDPGDGQFALIDSVEQLFELQRSTFGNTLSDWHFIKRWSSLDRSEKLEKYNEFCSHELNFFLYCKDREFFNEVGKPFLKNKARKDIVDYFLLGDVEKVRHLTRISLIGKYSPWELAMAYSLTKDESIFKYMTNMPQKENSNYKTMFDSVLAFYQHEESDSSHKSINTASAKVTGMISGGEARYMDTRCDESARPMAMYKMSKGGGKRHGGLKFETEEGYTAVGSTFEFKETYYYDKNPQGVQACWEFWIEVVQQLNQGIEINDIISEKFFLGNGSLVESLMMLSVIGFALGNQKKGKLMLTKVVSNGCQESEDKDSVLVSQVIFESSKPYETIEGKQRVRSIKELVKGKVYSIKATATNTTESTIDCDLTLEIPQGSIPLGGDNIYTSKFTVLKPFETFSFIQEFYFPNNGTFTTYPVTASQEGSLLRFSPSSTNLNVSEEENLNKEYTFNQMVGELNFNHVSDLIRSSQDISEIKVILKETESLLVIKEAYDKIIAVCRLKSIYNKDIWKYSLVQGDLSGLREYLEARFLHAEEPISLNDFTLYFIESPLLKLDAYIPREYDPLVNPRVHLQGNFKHNISNSDFLDTYMHFLKYFVDKLPTHISQSDKLLFVVYLVAQDRQTEALRLMDSLGQISDVQQLQYDYLRAYSLVTTSPDAANLEAAKDIVDKYKNYPVVAWEKKFAAVDRLLSEIRGNVQVEFTEKEGNILDTNSVRANEQPTLQLASHEGRIVLSTRNIEEVSLQFFIVDIETKFSLNPFDVPQSSSSGLVKANYETTLKVDGQAETDGSQRMFIDVPEQLLSKNLLVQASAKGLVATADFLPSSLAIRIIGNEVEVTAQGSHLKGSYVKVFARPSSGGSVVFFKDGYTNLLGRFEFASVCLEKIDRFSEFSLLALDHELGAAILRFSKSDLQKIRQTSSQSGPLSQLQSEIGEAIKAKKNKYAIA